MEKHYPQICGVYFKLKAYIRHILHVLYSSEKRQKVATMERMKDGLSSTLVHAYNPKIWELEDCKFKVIQVYIMRLCLKFKRKKIGFKFEKTSQTWLCH